MNGLMNALIELLEYKAEKKEKMIKELASVNELTFSAHKMIKS